jgi:hypothetical protein
MCDVQVCRPVPDAAEDSRHRIPEGEAGGRHRRAAAARTAQLAVRQSPLEPTAGWTWTWSAKREVSQLYANNAQAAGVWRRAKSEVLLAAGFRLQGVNTGCAAARSNSNSYGGGGARMGRRKGGASRGAGVPAGAPRWLECPVLVRVVRAGRTHQDYKIGPPTQKPSVQPEPSSM